MQVAAEKIRNLSPLNRIKSRSIAKAVRRRTPVRAVAASLSPMIQSNRQT
jgi:hypothetical protein